MSPSRKLAVILHADVVGSTTLVQINETIAHQKIRDVFRRFANRIEAYGGIAHEIRGDALVAEFSRASDAVAAAIAYQSENAQLLEELLDEIKPELRVGIAMGEVVIADSTITGDGVVLAQRLEQLASNGSVVVQGTVSETVPIRLPFEFEDLGEQTLKGFTRPIRAFVACLKPGESVPEPEPGHDRNETLAVEDSGPEQTATSANFEKPGIAVLPFTNMSDDAGQEYFCDGITEDIITALSRNRWYNVTSRNSTFAYKGSSPDVRQVATALGVDYVLEGSVRKRGERVRITAQLIDAKTDSHIWADRFNRQLEDEFAIQDEIAQRVASVIVERIWQDIAKSAAHRPAATYGAYEYTFLGIELVHRIDPDDTARGSDYLLKALELAPELSTAHLGLGFCRLMDWALWDDASGTALDQAYQHAMKNAELAPDDANTYRLLSRVYMAKRMYEESQRCVERALKINPDDGDIIGNKGIFHLFHDDPREAIVWFDKVLELHSDTPHTVDIMRFWKSLAQFSMLDYAVAVATLKSIIGLDYVKNMLLAACYAQLGLTSDAEEMVLCVLRMRPNLHLSDLGICDNFRLEKNRQHLRDALRAAGLPG
jgi:adenylate cyclase